MAKIIVKEIEEEINEIQSNLFALERQYAQYEEFEEPEKEMDEYQLAEKAMAEQIAYERAEIEELHIKQKRLERLKQIKMEGDEYLSIYPRGFCNEIKGQKDYEVKDLLSRKEEAKVIASKIQNGEVKTVGVFGNWGTGKSTFLGYIQEELNTKDIVPIRIDASEYSDQEKIWAYIYSAISDEFNKKFWQRIWFLFSRIWNNKVYIFLNLLVSIGVVVFVAYPATRGLVDYAIKNTQNENIFMWTDTAIIVSYVFLYCKYVFPKILKINSGFKNISKWFQKNIVTPNQDEILGYKAEIKKNTDDLLNLWKKKIVLLIDELDRCNKEVIASFFDTMQLYQHSPRIQIIYAVDRKVIDSALVKKGIEVDEVEEYMKKYIDYGINIYPINKNLENLQDIIKQYQFTKNELLIIFTFIHKNLQVNITIRDLKEILNILCEIKSEWISKYILTKQYEDDENYVIAYKKFIPWAIYALTNSKWISYMLEDIPNKAVLLQNYGEEIEFNAIIRCNQLGEKYKNCPDYLKKSIVMDIICYKELIEKYKAI